MLGPVTQSTFLWNTTYLSGQLMEVKLWTTWFCNFIYTIDNGVYRLDFTIFWGIVKLFKQFLYFCSSRLRYLDSIHYQDGGELSWYFHCTSYSRTLIFIQNIKTESSGSYKMNGIILILSSSVVSIAGARMTLCWGRNFF